MKYLVNKTRWLQVAVVIAASIFLVSGIAYAVVSVDKPVPATVSVNFQASPEGALGFYSDLAATTPLTTLNFGQLKPGVTGTVKVYIKNLTVGTSFRYFSVTDDLLKGTSSIYPEDYPAVNNTFLSPGQVLPFDIFLKLDSDITAGPYNFTITVNARTSL